MIRKLKNDFVESPVYLSLFNNNDDNLQEKINRIWIFSSIEIQSTENKQRDQIIKLYKAINKNTNVDGNIKQPVLDHLISKNKLNTDTATKFPVARAYLFTLIEMKYIHDQLLKHEFIAEKDFDKFNKNLPIFKDDKYFEDVHFINKIVPTFFNLIKYGCDLNKLNGIILQKSRNVELNSIRSIIAATYKNYGQHILKDKFITLLNTIEIETRYKSIEDLFNNEYNSISKVLTEYQASIGTYPNPDGPAIRYGKDITTEGLINIFHRWKRDPEFLSSLKEMCDVKKKDK